MSDSLKEQWEQLKTSAPGERFQNRYHQHHPQKTKNTFIQRLGRAVLAVILVFIGIIFLFIPGPGWPIIFLGMAYFSSESIVVAKIMDRLEVGLRNIISKVFGQTR